MISPTLKEFRKRLSRRTVKDQEIIERDEFEFEEEESEDDEEEEEFEE